MYYRAIDIARYVVTYCTKIGKPISNLQLQKILYFVQLNFIVNYGEVAFEDDMEAWQHGPVIPEVYQEFMYDGNKILRNYPNVENRICGQDKDLIDMIVEQSIKLDPWQLVEISHKKDSPWYKVYKKGERNVIPKDIIVEYGREIA